MLHCLLSGVLFINIISNCSYRAVDTPGRGKDVVDGFNAVQKRYLATCLRMNSTSEVYKIDINRMRVDAMTEKG